jgi:hypothetical protein
MKAENFTKQWTRLGKNTNEDRKHIEIKMGM